LFTSKIKHNNDLSIAIFKYDCDFNGKYYPGALACTHSLPLYIWAFGPSTQIKKISRLPIKETRETMIVQPCQELTPTYIVKKSRMLEQSTNSIMVSQWDKNRNGDTNYTLVFTVPISALAIDETYLQSLTNYTISDGYQIESISQIDNETLKFTITTNKPSPGTISINLLSSIPDWVKESNYAGNKVPNIGQTAGIAHLIEGVYDAYHNLNNNIATINIKLK
jgi:hypothetical protein